MFIPLVCVLATLAAAPLGDGDGPSATVTLIDGKSAEFTVDDPTVELATPFGTLSIPLTAVARILHGDHAAGSGAGGGGADAALIEAAIDGLSDPDISVREAAESTLRGIGQPASPALREAARSADHDVADRAQALLAEMGDAGPDSGASFDVVTTLAPSMVLRGEILNASYALTDGFSQRTVPAGMIREISFVPASMDRRLLPATLGDGPDVGNWRMSTEAPASWTALSFNDADWSIPEFHGRHGFAFPGKAVPGSFSLRRTFALTQDVSEAQLAISGVQSYQVVVNGQTFEGGESGILDIRRAVQAGPNVVAVRYTTANGLAAVSVSLK